MFTRQPEPGAPAALFKVVGVSILLVTAPLDFAQANSITSLDGNVLATVAVNSSNLTYSITYRGTPVIESSPLGFTVGNTNLGAGVTLGGFSADSWNLEFASRHGIHSGVTQQCLSQFISVTNEATHIRYIL